MFSNTAALRFRGEAAGGSPSVRAVLGISTAVAARPAGRADIGATLCAAVGDASFLTAEAEPADVLSSCMHVA